MKVGIISMQRVPNYGSFLQAYGLKKILESMGHEVVFVDYKEEPPVVPFSQIGLLKHKVFDAPFVKFMNDLIKYHLFGRKSFIYRYRMEYLKQLGIGYRKNTNENVDIAIIGSDEVFNCLQSGFNVGFSPMLFGQGVHAKKIISYAASFGYTDLAGLKEHAVDDRVASYLSSLSTISVRDNNSYYLVNTLTSKSPEIHLDPVLVSDFVLPEINVQFKNYVILYTYKSRTYSREQKEMILRFCKKNHKTLISIGNAQNWIENKIDATPLEVLSYFKYADFIISDTFHGSIFSIKYNKAFATFIRPDNRQKLSDLLCRVKKEDRIISSFDELQSMYEKKIDYSETNQIIEHEIKHTYNYLQRNLSL